MTKLLAKQVYLDCLYCFPPLDPLPSHSTEIIFAQISCNILVAKYVGSFPFLSSLKSFQHLRLLSCQILSPHLITLIPPPPSPTTGFPPTFMAGASYSPPQVLLTHPAHKRWCSSDSHCHFFLLSLCHSSWVHPLPRCTSTSLASTPTHMPLAPKSLSLAQIVLSFWPMYVIQLTPNTSTKMVPEKVGVNATSERKSKML